MIARLPFWNQGKTDMQNIPDVLRMAAGIGLMLVGIPLQTIIPVPAESGEDFATLLRDTPVVAGFVLFTITLVGTFLRFIEKQRCEDRKAQAVLGERIESLAEAIGKLSTHCAIANRPRRRKAG